MNLRFALRLAALLAGIAAVLIFRSLQGGDSSPDTIPDGNFRSQIAPGQALHVVTAHYRRGQFEERWVTEDEMTFESDGTISRGLTYLVQPDGSRRLSSSLYRRQSIGYGPDGEGTPSRELPEPFFWDIGYRQLRQYVERTLPQTKAEKQGRGTTILISRVDEFEEQWEMRDLDVDRLEVRWEIDEATGLLRLYRQSAVLRSGEKVTIGEDEVTAAQIIPMPQALSDLAPAAG